MKYKMMALAFSGATTCAIVLTAIPASAERGHNRHGMGWMGTEASFEQLDADGDGMVTQEEFDAKRTEMFAAQDADGDGALSEEELTAAIMKRIQDSAKGMAANAIEKLDDDNDGMLSQSEMKSWTGRKNLFEHIDDDGDGSLSRSEFDHEGDRDGKRRHSRKRHWH